jgi:hypothetical protein
MELDDHSTSLVLYNNVYKHKQLAAASQLQKNGAGYAIFPFFHTVHQHQEYWKRNFSIRIQHIAFIPF